MTNVELENRAVYMLAHQLARIISTLPILIYLSQDANAAVNTFRTYLKDKKIPIGLVSFSQAGWIIPITASKNPQIEFMVLFSCPTITTLEQLRFQFYTNGNTNFWKNHTEADAR